MLGRPIEIISADHQAKSDVASAVANRWIDVDNVLAIIDVPLSSAALAVPDITKRKSRIVFGVIAPETK